MKLKKDKKVTKKKNKITVEDVLGTYTDPIPDSLINALKSGNCVLLAGSGLSRRCLSRNRKPLPNWNELLKLLVIEANNNSLTTKNVIKELNDLLSRGEYLMVAQELIELIGEENVKAIINKSLDPDGITPSRLHEILSITPFRFFITTNYDNLLERAFWGTWHRQIERVCFDDTSQFVKLLNQNSKLVLKLHGDLDRPDTLVLGQKQYQYLLQNENYNNVLDDIFKNNSVLMLGYGLGDIDIQLTLDRLANRSKSSFPHFLLCPKDSKSSIEKKRLAIDRNVHVIEYVDYFGFHNHLDTFLKGANIAIDNSHEFERIRKTLRARITIHYPKHLADDGLFVWNLIFREGATTLSTDAQENQLKHLNENILNNFYATDYLIFIVDEITINDNNEFLIQIQKSIEISKIVGVQIMFLVVGANQRLSLLSKTQAPTFYVSKDFSEKDLINLLSYIRQDLSMGIRQP